MRTTFAILFVAAFFALFSLVAANEKAQKALQWIEQELTEEPLLSRLQETKLHEDGRKALQWVEKEIKKLPAGPTG